MNPNLYVVLMAGGVGTRFWPYSRNARPKQFLDVVGTGKTLIQSTYDRFKAICPPENFFVVTHEEHKILTKEQLPELGDAQILAEPMRKNTAPCILYASHKIYKLNKDAIIVVAPSDHLILKEDKFTEIVEIAIKTANQNNRLVTLGIKPTRPDTGYGYIEFTEKGDILGGQVREVKHFREKPERQVAELFLKSGNYYWNSGIFVWTAKTILDALKKFKPELLGLFSEENGFYNTSNEQSSINHCFEVCEDISIDFAVMENAKNVDVVLANFDWSDLGTWGSVYTHLDKDYNGNAVIGDNVYMINSSNCIVNLPNSKLALIEGLNNHIVVESDNMLMILHKNDEQNLKKYMSPMEDSSPSFFSKD